MSKHLVMMLSTELVDWRCFERPAQLGCYLGLVQGERYRGSAVSVNRFEVRDSRGKVSPNGSRS